MVGKESLKLQVRLMRRSARRLEQMVRFGRGLGNVPVLFANSFPKSGTHLLTQILQGFTRLGPAVDSGLPAVTMYDGFTGLARPASEILSDLARLLPGDIAYGHLHAEPELIARLTQPGWATYFILRDPRDVVVSHVHYVTDMEPNHIHHAYYKNELPDFEARLRASILGRPDPRIPFPDIRARFEPFVAWMDQPGVLSLHYEDFILEREVAVGQVLDHAVKGGFPLQQPRPQAVQALIASIDPQRSPTFRSGKTGEWRKKFSEANKTLFKEVAGDLLIRLGYEQNQDW